ncbi:hypothetical protein Taro_007205 [Colocasia esculenta]|uniref:Uncharacterized protein n=1 Tax=Colocasia esculenta TaxID=4460 RepID=A0A843TYD3_COLES|nr:hypothetical protein [Colocasia esculenta]
MYKIYIAKFQQKYKKVLEPGAYPEERNYTATKATLLEALAQHRYDAALNWKMVTKLPLDLRLWGVGVSLTSHWLSRELPQLEQTIHKYGSSKLY